MKNKILLSSASLVVLAAILGIGNALYGTDPETIVRLSTVTGILVGGSMGLFFVGLAYPKENSAINFQVTKKVSNG